MSTEHKTATDAAAHRATNARLCQWLGLRGIWRARSKETGQLSQSKFDSEEHANRMLRQFKSSEPYCEYPELATREGFWPLWAALKTKGYRSRVEDCGPRCVAWMAKDGHQAVPAQMAETPQAALFSAAVALMEREGGNG